MKSLEFGRTSEDGTRTLLPVSESWEYRYVALDRSRALTPTLTVEYETTYTVVASPSGWVVDGVLAEPLGEVE